MKTNKKHFNLFKSECRKWQDKFDLNKYGLCFEWKELGDADASMIAREDSMTATMALNKNIGYEGLNYDISFNEHIKKKALHECLHLLLWRLSEYGERRYVEQNQLLEAEEAIVRKLEKLL